MTRPAQASPPENLFDAIAKLLPLEQREYFYQRMLYFRHLRPEDELLRIAEAMGFLALVIRDAPPAIALEREQLAQILASSVASMQATAQAIQAYQKQLDDRLTTLPAAIAKGISPDAIARAIAESLRQQVVQSGLPVTADALAAVSKQLKQTTGDFQRSAGQLTDAYSGAATQARAALDALSASVANATDHARWVLTEFRETFRLDYRWSIGTLCGAALLIGLLLGFFLQSWRMSPSTSPAEPAVPPAPPTIHTAPPSAVPSPPPPTPKKRAPSPAPTHGH